MIETEVLIVGSGPSGSAAALFLSSYGIDVMVVTKHRWLANTPRAHITGQRTMEILNEFGVGESLTANAVLNDIMGNSIFCETLAGSEIARLKSWGAHPERISDYRIASPFLLCDIPQTYLEPIVLGKALQNGAHAKFSTEYVRAVQDADGVTVTVRDRLDNREYAIRAKYVIGADGARSQVAADANLPMTGKENQAGCINIFFDADLAPLVEHRPSAIFLIFSRAAMAGGIGVGALRMVRPWHEWLGVWNYDIDRPPPKLNGDEATAILRQMIGDYDTEIQVRSISTWTVNSRYATRYSNGRMFCVGDAVHRHPPNNGLGSNTSIQDSYNLAWKLAYVIKGQADAGLLDTYSDERAPVGRGIVERAMKSIDESRTLSAALGLDRAGALDEGYLTLGGEAGQRRREQFYVALRAKNYEFNGHGAELNHLYRSGAIAPDAVEPAPAEDQDLFHRFHSSFVAGARVPHVWLSLRGKEVSSLDLVGRGAFTVLTGIAGRAWALAAKRCATEIGLPVRASVIGPGEAVEDLYGDLYARCGFDESSCVLVRPDGHIAWIGTAPGDEAACAARLRAVLQQLLGLPQAAARVAQPASAVH